MMRAHELWILQCMATHEIRRRYGVKCALNYLVGEKLIRFATIADHDHEYAVELPRFQSAIWNIFDRYEIATYLSTLRPNFRQKIEALLLVSCSSTAPAPGRRK